MKTRYLRGTSAQLNQLNLDAGHLAFDTEKKAIRFFDGETQGGFEVLGVPVELPLPGPTELVAGNLDAGFYGEVPPEDFISYGELSTLVGLSAGTLHNQNQPWLKFSMDNRPCYVAKKTIRYAISHDQLAGVGLVYGGKSVVIGEITYVIRLLTGLDGSGTHTAGGEWNRLLYPVHVDDPNQQGWDIGYSDTDLGVGDVSGNGRANWTQETHPADPTWRVTRGYSFVEGFNAYTSSNANSAVGWRPILVPQL